MEVSHAMDDMSPEEQLDRFIAKFTPEIAAQTRAVHAKMQARLPGAIELIYDNYNALVIGFGPTDRPSDAVFSIAAFPRWVSLFFFFHGPALPDPQRLLKGKGSNARHIVLTGPETLDAPAVKALMMHALKRSPKPFDPRQRNRIVIKSISTRQRPRRPAQAPR